MKHHTARRPMDLPASMDLPAKILVSFIDNYERQRLDVDLGYIVRTKLLVVTGVID